MYIYITLFLLTSALDIPTVPALKMCTYMWGAQVLCRVVRYFIITVEIITIGSWNFEPLHIHSVDIQRTITGERESENESKQNQTSEKKLFSRGWISRSIQNKVKSKYTHSEKYNLPFSSTSFRYIRWDWLRQRQRERKRGERHKNISIKTITTSKERKKATTTNNNNNIIRFLESWCNTLH